MTSLRIAIMFVGLVSSCFAAWPRFNVTNHSKRACTLTYMLGDRRESYEIIPGSDSTILWQTDTRISFVGFRTARGDFHLSHFDQTRIAGLWFVIRSEYQVDVYLESDVHAQGELFDEVKAKIEPIMRLFPKPPNQALEPTRGAVTPPADAGVAPAPRVAHL